MEVEPCSVSVIKGYTKLSCVVFGLLAASDFDLSNDDHWKQLEPMFPFLDRAWLIPAHVSWLPILRFSIFQFQFHTPDRLFRFNISAIV